MISLDSSSISKTGFKGTSLKAVSFVSITYVFVTFILAPVRILRTSMNISVPTGMIAYTSRYNNSVAPGPIRPSITRMVMRNSGPATKTEI